MTYRGKDLPPAPPPIDPAERFGIRFERLEGSERRDRPWSEGILHAPGVTVELPRGWWPVVSMRSRNGFPVTLIDERGARVGRLDLAPSGSPIRQAVESEGWEARKRPSRNRATAVYQGPDGRMLFVGKGGGGFLLEPEAEGVAETDSWKILVGGLRLTRSAQ
jgi:hypothetical protein